MLNSVMFSHRHIAFAARNFYFKLLCKSTVSLFVQMPTTSTYSVDMCLPSFNHLDVPTIVLLRVSSLSVNSSLSMVMLSTVSENVSFCVEPPSTKDDDITVD